MRVVEPIDPELVLIDPELARVERARLVERAGFPGWQGVAIAPAVQDHFSAHRWPDYRLRHPAQIWVDSLTLIAWIGVAVGIVLFIAGLNR